MSALTKECIDKACLAIEKFDMKKTDEEWMRYKDAAFAKHGWKRSKNGFYWYYAKEETEGE